MAFSFRLLDEARSGEKLNDFYVTGNWRNDGKNSLVAIEQLVAFFDRTTNAVGDFAFDINPEHVVCATMVGQRSEEKRTSSDGLLHVTKHRHWIIIFLRSPAKDSMNIQVANLTLTLNKRLNELLIFMKNVLQLRVIFQNCNMIIEIEN